MSICDYPRRIHSNSEEHPTSIDSESSPEWEGNSPSTFSQSGFNDLDLHPLYDAECLHLKRNVSDTKPLLSSMQC